MKLIIPQAHYDPSLESGYYDIESLANLKIRRHGKGGGGELASAVCLIHAGYKIIYNVDKNRTPFFNVEMGTEL